MTATRCPFCAADLTPLRKGGWFCEDCDRRYDAGLRALSRRASSPPPAPPRASRPPPSAPASSLDAMPFVIAHPLARSRRPEASLEERAGALLGAAYQLVRLAGVLMLSDYLASPDDCRKVNLAVRALRTPDWWGWTVLCNQLVRFWGREFEDKPSREPRLARLVVGWRGFNHKNARSRRDSKWGTLLEGLAGRDGPAHSANDALWHAFERRGRAAPDEEGGTPDETLARIDRLVETAAQRLFEGDGVRLLRCVPGEGPRYVELRGPHLDARFALLAPPAPLSRAVLPHESVALVGDEVVPLFPLLMMFESERVGGGWPGGGLTEPMLVEGHGASARAVLGRGDQVPRLVGPSLDAFREKKIDALTRENEVTVASVAPWAALLLGNSLRQLRGRAYLAEPYVEREGVDDVLEAALQAPGRAALVVGPVGAGKTSLLARLAQRVGRSEPARSKEPAEETGEPITSARRGSDLVVLLSGRGAYSMAMERSGPEMLADAVARKLGIKEKRFKSLLDLCTALDEGGMRSEGRRLWLLLDALDEAEQSPALLAALDAFLPSLARYPWLRLALSLDEGLLRAQEGRVPFTHERLFARFYERDGRQLVAYLRCRPFHPQGELPRVFAGYLAGTRHLPAFEALSRPLLALLSHPLHVRLLASIQPAAWAQVSDEASLFQLFLSSLAVTHPRLPEALAQLGDAMLQHRSIDLLAGIIERSRQNPSAGPPFAELVAAGLLLPPCDDGGDGEEAYVPVSAAFVREVLLDALRRRIGGRWPTRDELASWAHEALGRSRRLDLASPFVACLVLVLEAVVERMMRDEQADTVASVIALEDEALRLRLLTAALVTAAQLGRASERLLTPFLAAASTDASPALLVAVQAARAHLDVWGHPGEAALLERLFLRLLRARDAANPSPRAIEAQARSTLTLASRLARGGQAELAGRHALEAARSLRALPASFEVLVSLGAALRLAASLLAAEARRAERHALLLEALEALRTAEQLDATDVRLLEEQAAVLGLLADDASGASERAHSVDRIGALVGLRRRLLALLPQHLDAEQALARALFQQAELELSVGNHAEARRGLEEAVTLLRALHAREPRWLEAQIDLWRVVGALGNLTRLQGMRAEGLRLLEEALEGLRLAQAREPTREDVQLELAMALSRTGSLLVMEGKRTRARRLLDEASSLLRERWRLHAEPAVGAELATALTGVGNVARVEGKSAEARTSFHEASWIWTSLVAHDERPDSLASLAQSLWNSSLVETDPPERHRFLDRLQQTLARLAQLGPLSPVLLRLSEMASRAMTSL